MDCDRQSNPANKAVRSLYTGGSNVLLGVGSVRIVNDGVNLLAWQADGTRASGEVLDER
jgi:hypothetical protein